MRVEVIEGGAFLALCILLRRSVRLIDIFAYLRDFLSRCINYFKYSVLQLEFIVLMLLQSPVFLLERNFNNSFCSRESVGINRWA